MQWTEPPENSRPAARRLWPAIAGSASALILTACGGGGHEQQSDGHPVPNIPSYVISGTISGLVGRGLVTHNYANDYVVTQNGDFVFEPDAFSPYNITITSQPVDPAQTCIVMNGSGGSVDHNISNVQVTCTTDSFTVGGTVAGLKGTGLVLQNNGGDDLIVNADGSFVFPTVLSGAATFNVSVRTQPSGSIAQTCLVYKGTGVISGAVSDVSVKCYGGTGRFLYVLNTGSDSVSAYSIDSKSGALTPLSGSPFSGTGTSPRSALVSPDSKFVYLIGSTAVTPPATGSLGGFSIDAVNGSLSPIQGLPISIDGVASGFSLHPSGKALFVHKLSEKTQVRYSQGLDRYSVDTATGKLTIPLGYTVEMNSSSGTFDRTGRYYFLAKQGVSRTLPPGPGNPGAVSGLGVNPSNGTNSYGSGEAWTSGLVPTSVIVHPSGRFVYAANYSATVTGSSNSISGFRVNADNAVALNAVVPKSPFNGGTGPSSILFGPTGQLYVVSAGADGSTTSDQNGISIFDVELASGTLLAASPPTFPTNGNAPMYPAFDPSDKYFVAINHGSNSIAVMTVDAKSGALAHVSGSPFPIAVGNSPGAVTFDPSGRFAYITDSGTNTVSHYSINPSTGAFTFVKSYATGTAPAPNAVVVGLQ